MTTIDLRNYLLRHLNGGSANAVPVNQEILDTVLPVYRIHETIGKQAIAYQVDETVVFISETGLTKPKQIFFIDSVSGESFLQEIE